MATDLNKLTVVELRAELKKHGLPQAGKKAELIERLSSAVENGSSNDANQQEVNDEQPADAQDQPKAATPTPEPTAEDSAAPVSVQEDRNSDAPEPANAAVPAEVEAPAPVTDEPSHGTVDASPQDEPVATTTISIPQEGASGEVAPAVEEVINDVQSRKRRSRTPSIDESVRKRLRPDDPEPRRVDTDMDDAPLVPDDSSVKMDEDGPAEAKNEPVDVKDESVEPRATPGDDANRYGANPVDDVAMEDRYNAQSDREPPRPDSPEDYPAERMQEDEPAQADYGADDRPVVPAMHPATSALYIKNLMRPLRPADVKDHLIALATPPSQEPNFDVIVDFFLDHIRTHAFVVFDSVSAASRVRSALHDRVWPDESNRKALWVDFVPADKVLDWIGMEEAEGGGRGKMKRWEVVYEVDADGNLTARLDEAGPDTVRPTARPAVAPPTGPASTLIPTGPSQPAAGGIQGAPTGPRGRGGRMPPGYPLQGGVTPQEGTKTTRALPSLLYRPQSEDVARRRVDNMRSYYTKDVRRDVGPVEDINRYTFENVDAFVDRGKEVFVGIRPPHRERQMRGGAGGGRPAPPPSGPRRSGGAPPSRPRGDRYFGGGGGGGFGGDSYGPPRSRLNGAPLPTYDGPSGGGRRGRFGR